MEFKKCKVKFILKQGEQKLIPYRCKEEYFLQVELKKNKFEKEIIDIYRTSLNDFVFFKKTYFQEELCSCEWITDLSITEFFYKEEMTYCLENIKKLIIPHSFLEVVATIQKISDRVINYTQEDIEFVEQFN